MKLLRLIRDYTVPQQPIQPEQAQPEQAQPEPVDAPPRRFGDIRLNNLLYFSDRRKENTPGDGHNNCAFNAILKQVGDRSSSSEMVNLLRRRLGYGDENSNQNFDTSSCSCQLVADLFERPVIDIHQRGGAVTQMCFSIPGVGNLNLHLTEGEWLYQNFIQLCKDLGYSKEKIKAISKLMDIRSLSAADATVIDFMVKLLQYPATIVLIYAEGGGHFDAAPHKDLQHEASVLELLRGEN
ncbi:MAG: hypothetical protein LBB17_03880 [Puniceicoccales bacterium]|jgi:hypothetical protein|nr:hypothetical protein [Puniceicoccales bacterium]